MGCFKILSEDKKTKARIGEIKTASGVVKTPCFVPDATYGVVKHLSGDDLRETNLQMVLGNVHHLSIRPGSRRLKKFGGLKKFMDWEGPLLTDSGGFQAYSMVHKNRMGKVEKGGVRFRDHLSGKEHFLTPQKSIQSQLDLGADVLMVLDYPVFPDEPKSANRYSVSLTTRWAKESKEYFDQHASQKQILMAIIQGAGDKELRKRSFQELERINKFSGYGFGGIVDGKNLSLLDFVANLIPEDRIRYLMGAGPPKLIIQAVAMGWDLFDCVVPTRNARHGLAYTFDGEIKIRQARYRDDQSSLEKDCPCLACQNYSRAYLYHLFKVKEPLGQRLLTLHNLTFYTRLMKLIREKISQGRLSDLLD